MSASKTHRLEIKKAKFCEKGFTYETFRLVGWHQGTRVRRQFKSRAEAEVEKNRLEVEAANAVGAVRPIKREAANGNARK